MSEHRKFTENDAAFEMFYKHLDAKHPEKSYRTSGRSCGTGSVACPLCDWQVFIEITGGKP